jgi:long-subunit fatty acid transport protein
MDGVSRTVGVFVMACAAGLAPAAEFVVSTPTGPFTIRVSHLGPSGSLVAPALPEPEPFSPPSVFSAPLPSGSGARALGLGGAFTALADDATAASWNPAGLIQLERPEFSAVYRDTHKRAEHRSADAQFRVGENTYGDDNLNYFSAVLPFRVDALDRNAVVSINHQEAYDFEHHFTADLRQGQRDSDRGTRRQSYDDVQVDHLNDGITELTVTTRLHTDVDSAFNQALESGLLTDLDFAQEGVISAVTPALALELTPKLSFGAAFNIYQLDPVRGGSIRSRTRAQYEGQVSSTVDLRTRRTTTGTYAFEGVSHLPPGGIIPIPIDIPFDGGGTIDPFTETAASRSQTDLHVAGAYEEVNEIDDFEGYNATLGLLWTVSRLVSLGVVVDLPWEGSGRQTRTVRNRAVTRDSRGRVVDEVDESTSEASDITMDFPLYVAAGAVFRWAPTFYTTLDVSQTHWSDFKYQADGQQAVNPLDGSAYGEHPLDDCWSVRGGAEYLVMLSRTEIPLRCGFGWEERPALEAPEEYYSMSLGTGLAIGQDPGRTMLDFAWVYTWADEVTGIVATRDSLRSDVVEQTFFVSVIQHL